MQTKRDRPEDAVIVDKLVGRMRLRFHAGWMKIDSRKFIRGACCRAYEKQLSIGGGRGGGGLVLGVDGRADLLKWQQKMTIILF